MARGGAEAGNAAGLSAGAWRDLGVFLLRRGAADKAQPALREALAASPPRSADRNASLLALGACQMARGSLDASEALLRSCCCALAGGDEDAGDAPMLGRDRGSAALQSSAVVRVLWALALERRAARASEDAAVDESRAQGAADSAVAGGKGQDGPVAAAREAKAEGGAMQHAASQGGAGRGSRQKAAELLEAAGEQLRIAKAEAEAAAELLANESGPAPGLLLVGGCSGRELAGFSASGTGPCSGGWTPLVDACRLLARLGCGRLARLLGRRARDAALDVSLPTAVRAGLLVARSEAALAAEADGRLGLGADMLAGQGAGTGEGKVGTE